MVVASVLAGFVLAISVTASAQYLTGRGVDMRSLSGQAASCRAPALKLKQEIIILRQDLSEILECNSDGSFLIEGDCVPYVSPGHAFSANHTGDPENRDALSFNNPDGTNTQWAEIGGADGTNIQCEPACESDSPIWPDCICDPDNIPYNPTHHLCFDPKCDPNHNDPECCDIYPNRPVCDEGPFCQENHNNPDCCDQFPSASICNGDPVCEEGHNDPTCCSEFPHSPACEECEEETDTRPGSCPVGEVGWIEEARNLVCPEAGDPYWTDWEAVEGGNFCCDGQKTEACPSGYLGSGITYTRASCEAAWQESNTDCYTLEWNYGRTELCKPYTTAGLCPNGWSIVGSPCSTIGNECIAVQEPCMNDPGGDLVNHEIARCRKFPME